MHIRLSTLAALAVFAVVPSAFAQPFADGPEDKEKKVAPRPDRRTWTIRSGEHAIVFEFTPGIAMPNQVAQILLTASRVPKTPHPRYGNQIPVEKARIVVEVKDADGNSLGRYLAHPIPFRSGEYGLHVTPRVKGIHTLEVVGRTANGTDLTGRLAMSVDVWPLPTDMEGKGAVVEGARARRRPIVVSPK